jgi:RNA polymerase sigma-70 factor (ECF subfamily)
VAPNQIDIHEALVHRCRKGDSRAQAELYRIYARSMYNVSMRIVNHVGEAEDILQESFVDAFTKITSLKNITGFGGWLKAIVVNRSLNYLKKRRLQLTDDMELAERVEDSNDNSEQTDWDIKQVHEAIQQLPDGYRVVLTLYLLEDYSHAEIAAMLNISESASKSQYSRAKASVRKQLLKQSV